MTKYRFFCSDCQVEAKIVVTDPGDHPEDLSVGCCFCCGSDAVEAEEIDED